MNRDRRLEDLERRASAAPGTIPDAEVNYYCDACLGPRAYRRRIDAARARLVAAGWNGISGSGLPGETIEHETIEEMQARHARWATEAAAAQAEFICRGCGAEWETYDAIVLKVRREAGLE
jgi:hypothetical protein